MKAEQRALIALLAAAGIAVLAFGIVYFVVEAKSLPGFLGPLHAYGGHRTKRGLVGVIAGIALLAGAGAGIYLWRPRRPLGRV